MGPEELGDMSRSFFGYKLCQDRAWRRWMLVVYNDKIHTLTGDCWIVSFGILRLGFCNTAKDIGALIVAPCDRLKHDLAPWK